MKNKDFGAIGMWYEDRDWQEELSGSSSLYWKAFNGIIYNQKLVDRYSCTGQAACGVISDVTGAPLPLSFRKQVWENQIKTGAVNWRWDYAKNGIKQAVKLFNEEFPELPYKLGYYRIDNIRDYNKVAQILNWGSSILTGYKWSLYSDAQDNGVIDNNDNPNWGGHIIRIVKIDGDEIKYVDNYEWVNKYNVITVKDLKNNRDFFRWGYYIKKLDK